MASDQGEGPFIAGPKKSKTIEDRITPMQWLHWMESTLQKSTPRLQSLTVKAKMTTWIFTVLCHSYFHTVEKRNGNHYISFH